MCSSLRRWLISILPLSCGCGALWSSHRNVFSENSDGGKQRVGEDKDEGGMTTTYRL